MERKVGEVFEIKLKTFSNDGSCVGCIFSGETYFDCNSMKCKKHLRADKTNVIFVEIKED